MEINAAAERLNALASPARLQIFRYLVRHADQSVCVGDLAQALEMKAATLSFHLRELSRAGVIQPQQQGRHIFYQPALGAVQELVNFLLEDCCAGGNCEQPSIQVMCETA